MIDCGFGVRDTAARLARLGLAPDDLDAIVVTHEHSDHVGGVAAFASRHAIPSGAFGTLSVPSASPAWSACTGSTATTRSAWARSVASVPRSPRRASRYGSSSPTATSGWAWSPTSARRRRSSSARCRLHALVLECNHDAAMLAEGKVPAPAQARIVGRYGTPRQRLVRRAARVARRRGCATWSPRTCRRRHHGGTRARRWRGLELRRHLITSPTRRRFELAEICAGRRTLPWQGEDGLRDRRCAPPDLHYRDDVSAFDVAKLAKLEGKGETNNRINAPRDGQTRRGRRADAPVRLIDDRGVARARDEDDSGECVVRNVWRARWPALTASPEGLRLPEPVFEFFTRATR
ncbi:MAG: MBL fold metallo-hydrolase [Betaproteobacteria bacterium]|nr:MBL fold metallo-hydrolase [Betaproteobacteria bacterium]